jgi:hypothetical protein
MISTILRINNISDEVFFNGGTCFSALKNTFLNIMGMNFGLGCREFLWNSPRKEM